MILLSMIIFIWIRTKITKSKIKNLLYKYSYFALLLRELQIKSKYDTSNALTKHNLLQLNTRIVNNQRKISSRKVVNRQINI